MKIKEITDKDTEALQLELSGQFKHLYELRTQAVTEKLEDPTQLGKTKRTIARIKTVIQQRKLAEAKNAPAPAVAAAK